MNGPKSRSNRSLGSAAGPLMGAGLALAWLYPKAVRAMIQRSCRRMNEGDIKPLLDGYGDDAVLVFPGDTSWSGEHRGKADIERFLRRFVSNNMRLEPEDIVVSGPPWNTTVCVRFRDHATDADGRRVYENVGVIWTKAVWGKIVHHQDYIDTVPVGEFDKYLAEHEVAPT